MTLTNETFVTTLSQYNSLGKLVATAVTNLTEYIGEQGAMVAHYEYSPFGEIIESVDSEAVPHQSFTHGWSTKPWCSATRLNEYEYRQYSPDWGRWLSRDPLEEFYDINCYSLVINQVVNIIDVLGFSGTDTRNVSVKKCEAVLYIGHSDRKKPPIAFDFPKDCPPGCAIGGAVCCWPRQTNPPKDSRWPTVPNHGRQLFGTGAMNNREKTDGLLDGDLSDYSEDDDDNRNKTQAADDALGEDAHNDIMEKLCTKQTGCCTEVTFTY